MPHSTYSFEYYCNALIRRGATRTLLDDVIKKGANIISILNAVQHEELSAESVVTQFQSEWQLLILGDAYFDLAWQNLDFLKQQDNLGKTPVHYFALSGNVNVLAWVKVNHPDLLMKKDNTGRTMAHYTAESGRPETLAWLQTNYPQLLNEEANVDQLITPVITPAIADLLSESKCPEALTWIKERYPELFTIADLASELKTRLKKVDPELFIEHTYRGMTITSGATCIGCHDALNWIKVNYPEVLVIKCGEDRFRLAGGRSFTQLSIVHLAARAGHIDVLTWFKANNPELLREKDVDGCTIAHVAMNSANFDMLDWIQENNIELMSEINLDDHTIAELSIILEDMNRLTWVQRNNPELMKRTNRNFSENIAHLASQRGNIKILAEIQKYYPELLVKKSRPGYTIAYFAACSGHLEGLIWINENNPALLTEKTNKGITIAHVAARLKTNEAITWIQKNYPDLLMETDEDGRTIVHFAAGSGRENIINYLLQEHPALLKKLWVRDENGDTPHEVQYHMATKPNQLRDNALLAATNRHIEGQPKPNDTELLLAFQDEWRDILLKRAGYNLQDLVNSVSRFPLELQRDITTLESMFALMAFSFEEKGITQDNLQALLRLTFSVIPAHRPVFFRDRRPLLIQQLQLFIGKLGQEALTDKQIFCLQLIVQDYEQGLLGNSTLALDLLVKKLVTSPTLANLRPKVDINVGMDIRVETFPAYFQTLVERVSITPLNDDETTTMREIILPGIETIIRDEEAIVQHVTTHKAEIYYLNGNLPIHTDHAPTADANAYRQTLRHLLTNFFGAVEIAHSKARLKEFCEKISNGNCLEGRVRYAFEWAATLTEIVSFDDLMNRYIHQEYVPYTEVMFDMSVEDIPYDSTICDFIIARHEGMPCLPNPIYAPTDEVTQSGVRKYLTEVLGYTLPVGSSLTAL